MLKINEVFFSAQGEGSRVGIPTVFIRLAGCSAQCSYCDTKNSWTEGRLINEDELHKTVLSFREKYKDLQVVITGGEPFEQDIRSLVLKLKESEFFIAIETNGNTFYETDIDWYSVSPKDIYDFSIHSQLKSKIDELKLIVNKNLKIEIIKNIRNIGDKFPIFLQPEFYSSNKYKETYLLYENCLISGIKNIRLGFQLHRLYGIE